jgi:hypothetical protein
MKRLHLMLTVILVLLACTSIAFAANSNVMEKATRGGAIQSKCDPTQLPLSDFRR